MHSSTFEYLAPTDQQKADMEVCRKAAADYLEAIMPIIPSGPDKTYMIRHFREAAMWANIAITRDADGSPRQ